MTEAAHIPVLLQEVLEGLAIGEGSIVVDATLGGSGYATLLCERIGAKGTLIGIDQDAGAVYRAHTLLASCPCTTHLFEQNFRYLDHALTQANVYQVDAVVFDLGLSSIQLEKSGRGFSFMRDEPLTMTFKETPGEDDLTASYIVNTWKEESLANAIYGYGGEPNARRIARAIVDARTREPITTTRILHDLIVSVQPRRHTRIDPATKTFQALRIVVNDEVGALEEGLDKGLSSLRRGGRMAVVTFHSLEDRIVKTFFVRQENEGSGRRITKKPITPTDKEIEENPRSRSAKLRIFEKA